MYAVSEDYKAAIKQPVTRFRATGTIAGIPFSDENILQGSLHVSNQCSDDSLITVGSVYTGELKVTLMGLGLPRGTLKNVPVTLSIGLKVGEGYEDVPVGIFSVSEADWGASGIAITAYDAMARFDKVAATDIFTAGSIYEFLTTCCKSCDVPLGMTEEELKALPNGKDTLSLYKDSDIETFRDVVSWCAATTACFATIDRKGQLVFRPYGGEPIDTIDTEHRFEGGKVSDFTTRYTGLYVTDVNTKAAKYYSLDPDDALTYDLGTDPLLQYGTEEGKEQQRKALLDGLSKIAYTPCEISLAPDISYDLGDVLTLTGGIAGDSVTTCVTKIDFTYNSSVKITCVGKDPALATARSKVDKNLAGLMSKTDEDAVHYYDYENDQDIDIGDGKNLQVISIRYATSKANHVAFFGELLLDVDTDATAIVKATYYLLDSEFTSFHPVETYEKGQHVLNLILNWHASANVLGSFALWLSVTGGSLHIKKGHIRAFIEGLGLVGEGDWDGTIKAEDVVPEYDLTKTLPIVPFTDTPVVSFPAANDAGPTDIVPDLSLSWLIRKMPTDEQTSPTFWKWFTTLDDEKMSYDKTKIEVKNNAWKLKTDVTVGEMLTPDIEVDAIIGGGMWCDSRSVTFLASFDSGKTFLEFSDGTWHDPDATKETIGTFGAAFNEITEEEWATKLQGHVMIKAIIHDSGTVSEIGLQIKEERDA